MLKILVFKSSLDGFYRKFVAGLYIYIHYICVYVYVCAFESVLMRWMNLESIIQSEVKSERER